MSLRGLRSRFLIKSDVKEKDVTSTSKEDDEFVEVLEPENDRFSALTDFCQSLSDSLSISSFHNDEDKAVFEQQLNNLQEQLVSVMIENQSLAQKLKRTEEEAPLIDYKNKVLHLTQRCKVLESKLEKKQKPVRRGSFTDSNVELAEEADRDERNQSVTMASMEALPPENRVGGMRTRIEGCFERLIEKFYDIFEDFTPEPGQVVGTEETPLAVKTLKANIKRFQTALKPYMDTVKGVNNLITWKSPAYTFLCFLLYMYTVYKGVSVPFLLMLMIIKLAFNYLVHKNILMRGITFLDPGEEKATDDKELGVSDKFNLVLMVARKVQNGLGVLADNLEKLTNLLTWRYMPATKQVMKALCLGLIFTFWFSASTVVMLAGLGMGVKIFVITPLFTKYPRLKQKHDNTYRLWLALPTYAEYRERVARDEMKKYIVVEGPDDKPQTQATHIMDSVDDSDSGDEDLDNKEFRELFSLPSSECPLPGWSGGKRTVLIGKDRHIVSLLSKKRGKLYITKSFLCFEREKFPSRRNIVIPLCEVVKMVKVKPIAMLPGRGMAIQIQVKKGDRENVFVFGGIIGRDEVMTSLEEAQKKVLQGGGNRTSLTDKESRRSSSQSRKSDENVTFALDYVESD